VVGEGPIFDLPFVAVTTFLRRFGPRVVFSTYQSSPQIAEAFELGQVPTLDLVVADESHRCAGPISSAFGTVLDAEKIKARRRLFMTATPRYFTGRVRKEAKEADFEVASMDDEEKFGPVFHRLGFSEAIKRDLLTDYQVVVVGVVIILRRCRRFRTSQCFRHVHDGGVSRRQEKMNAPPVACRGVSFLRSETERPWAPCPRQPTASPSRSFSERVARAESAARPLDAVRYPV
jgi:hypothetical protein